MRLILTNDDGVDAPGLEALARAVAGIGEATILAPIGPYSGCGHAVTTRGPIRVERQAEGWIGVGGTPADCVRLGLHHLAREADWVLAGINEGGNLGADVYHSGTVAAAREAVLHGRPAIALSHYHARGRAIDWERASRWTGRAVAELLARPWEPGTFWNVNLPHPADDAPEPAIVFCPLDPSPLPLSFRVEGDVAVYDGDYHRRDRVPGADVATCFNGAIAVTLIHMLPVRPTATGLAPDGTRPA